MIVEDPGPIVGIPELGRLLGMSRPLTHYWLGRCKVTVRRLGNRLFVYESEVPGILAAVNTAREEARRAPAPD